MKTGGGVNSGTEGGALLGGEPENSGSVTKKKSLTGPVLFWANSKKLIQNQKPEIKPSVINTYSKLARLTIWGKPMWS